MSEEFDELRAELEEEAALQVRGMVAMACDLDDVDALEEIGAHLAVRGAQDPEGSEALIRAFAAGKDPATQALLDAMGFFAPAELSERIDAVLGELDDEIGSPSPLPGSFGDLSVPRALRVGTDVADSYLAWIERVGYEEEPRLMSLTVLTLDQGASGGPLLAGELSSPIEHDEAERHVTELLAGGEVAASELSAEQLREALGAALAENRRQEWEVSFELGVCLPILAVALSGDPDLFGYLPVREPEIPPERDDLEDSEFAEHVHGKLEEFMEWAERTGTGGEAVIRSGHMIAGSMLEWKWTEGDGALNHWTEADLGDFLLDFVPRKVTTDDDFELGAPDCVAAYLAFLNERGELSGDSLRDLTEACRELHDDFLDVATDRARWGPAKAMAMQMRAEGVDASDPEALTAWMDDFNSRPFEERDRIVGPSLDARRAEQPFHGNGSGGSGRTSAGEGKARRARRAKRKAAKQARRRGRH